MWLWRKPSNRPTGSNFWGKKKKNKLKSRRTFGSTAGQLLCTLKLVETAKGITVEWILWLWNPQWGGYSHLRPGNKEALGSFWNLLSLRLNAISWVELWWTGCERSSCFAIDWILWLRSQLWLTFQGFLVQNLPLWFSAKSCLFNIVITNSLIAFVTCVIV